MDLKSCLVAYTTALVYGLAILLLIVDIHLGHVCQKLGRDDHVEAMRRRLIADVSHELRTPITAIKGSMEGLMDGVLPAEYQIFQQIHNRAVRSPLSCLSGSKTIADQSISCSVVPSIFVNIDQYLAHRRLKETRKSSNVSNIMTTSYRNP
jgi:signal transduction histidine kinase